MRWVFRRTFSCDLLVVDTIGKGWLNTCLPNYSTIELLNIREERIFLLDVGFIFRLLMSCLWQSVKNDGTLQCFLFGFGESENFVVFSKIFVDLIWIARENGIHKVQVSATGVTRTVP